VDCELCPPGAQIDNNPTGGLLQGGLIERGQRGK